MKFVNSLFGRVVIALILGVGIGIGIVAPDFAKCLQPLGDGFVKLIQMIIAPLVFSVVVTGICGSGDLKKVGRVGLKTIIYFELMTTFALVIGALMANTLHPGSGMNIDVHSLDSSAMFSVRVQRSAGAGRSQDGAVRTSVILISQDLGFDRAGYRCRNRAFTVAGDKGVEDEDENEHD